MKQFSEFLLGTVALAALGFSAFWIAHDVRQTFGKPESERPPTVLPTREAGWYPSPKQPIFGWDDAGQTEGWQLEADAPLELAQSPSTIVVPMKDEPDDNQELPAPLPVVKDEEDPQPTGPGSLSISSEFTSGEGSTSALKVPVSFPDPATIYRSASALVGVRYVAYDVYIPAEVSGFVSCLFFLKDKDGLWYQARSRQRLLPGQWTTVAAEISGGSPDVTPLGHMGQWEENQASQIRTIGITFYGDRAYKGSVYVDNFRGWMRAENFKRAVARLERNADSGDTKTGEHLEAMKELAKVAAAAAPEPLQLLNMRTSPIAPPDEGTGNSPPSVNVYQTFSVSFDINRQIYNPFDPDVVDVRATITPPKGPKIEVFGFWFQDFERATRYNAEQLTPLGRPQWRVRFTPRLTGEYKMAITVKLKGEDAVTSPEIPFVAIPSQMPGFVSVSKTDPSYFEFDNGAFFYPIGFNFHTPIDTRCWSTIFKQEHPLFRGLTLYEGIFPKMEAAGQNTCEIWMASWWLGIEWTRRWPTFHGVGRYSLENAWKMDQLLENARKHGIYLHVAIDNHGKFSEYVDPEWEFNPYNRGSDSNGPVEHPSEFFTSDEARKLHKQRLRYIAARWAGDTNVLGWEMVSEFNLVGNGRRNPRGGPIGQGDYHYYKTQPARDWVKEMTGAWRSYDPYGRPVTNHYSGDFNVVDRELALTPAFDYIVGDGYREQPGYVAMAMGWHQSYGQAKKPFWVTEFGGYWNASTPPRLKADLHTGLWASWMTNSAATPLFWWYDFIDHYDQYPKYKAFHDYIKGEDKRGLKGFTENVGFAARGEGLGGMQYRWSEGVYLWVYDEQAQREMPEKGQFTKHEGVQVTVPGLTEGNYRVEYWNTATGAKLQEGTQTLAPGARLALQLPAFLGDVAIKAKRVKPNEPPARTVEPSPSTPAQNR